MAHNRSLYRSPELDLRNKYPRLREVGAVIALGLLTILFYSFKDFKPAEKLQRLPDVSIVIEEIPQTKPYKKPLPPDLPKLPEISENPDLPPFESTWTSNINFGDTNFEAPILNEAEPEVPFPELSEEPKVIERVIPIYPEMARRLGITGTVFVEIVINTQGEVESPRVVSGHIMLNDVALEAVSKWRFQPGMQWNRPVRVRMTIPVQFRFRN
jgi:TonB family protein